MGEIQPFLGRVAVEKRESALQTASEWRKNRVTLWTDGPRLDSRRVGAAVVRWEEEG